MIFEYIGSSTAQVGVDGKMVELNTGDEVTVFNKLDIASLSGNRYFVEKVSKSKKNKEEVE